MDAKTAGPAVDPGAKPGANATPAERPAEDALPSEPAPSLPARVAAPTEEPAASKFPVLPTVGVDLITLCAALVRAGYFPDLKTVSQAMVKVLAGQELGIGPIRAMTDIHVTSVDGRPHVTLGATLMASLIQRSGRFDYAVRELTDEACDIEFFELRGGNGERQRVALGKSRFTMEDARKAKLAGKANWLQYPRNMLFSRSMSNGAKWYCSGVFGGPVYTPEEIRDIPTDTDEPPAPAGPPAAPPGPPAEPALAQEDRPPAAPQSPGAGPTGEKAGPAGGAPRGAAGGSGNAQAGLRPADPAVEGARQPPFPEAPERRPAMDASEWRAYEQTWRRLVRAMAAINMTESEMRGIARTFYNVYPEEMGPDQLALLAGRIENSAPGVRPEDAYRRAAKGSEAQT